MPTHWKIGLPMYLNTLQIQQQYLALLDALVDQLRALGFHEKIDIVQDFPAHLMDWWRDENLLFSQSCGYPYITQLKDQVHLLATPCFNVQGCESAHYSSVFVCHQDQPWNHIEDARHSRVVMNQVDSNSGMNVLRAEIAKYAMPDQRFFSDIHWSGSHQMSLKFIQEKQADLAAIDCVTWAYLKAYAPEQLYGIRVLGFSQASYALPYITSKRTDHQLKVLIFKALKNIQSDHVALFKSLFIRDIIQSSPEDYQSILALEKFAQDQRYFELSVEM